MSFVQLRNWGLGEGADVFTGCRKDRRATSSRCFRECPLWLVQGRAPKAVGVPARRNPGREPPGPGRQPPPLHVVRDADGPRPAWFPNPVTQQLRRGRLRPNCARGCVCVAVAALLGEEWDISIVMLPGCRAPSRSQRGTVDARRPRSPSRQVPATLTRGSVSNR